jgi:hypothetical protein
MAAPGSAPADTAGRAAHIPGLIARVREVNNGLGAQSSLTPFAVDGQVLGYMKPRWVAGTPGVLGAAASMHIMGPSWVHVLRGGGGARCAPRLGGCRAFAASWSTCQSSVMCSSQPRAPRLA